MWQNEMRASRFHGLKIFMRVSRFFQGLKISWGSQDLWRYRALWESQNSWMFQVFVRVPRLLPCKFYTLLSGLQCCGIGISIVCLAGSKHLPFLKAFVRLLSEGFGIHGVLLSFWLRIWCPHRRAGECQDIQEVQCDWLHRHSHQVRPSCIHFKVFKWCCQYLGFSWSTLYYLFVK